MFSEILTFIFFILIGLEIREGLERPKAAILPALCALSGMLVPAFIFILFRTGTSGWAIAMPTDVALAIGALSILGKKVNPSIRIFLLTLAVADDFFSLVVIGIFFRKDLHLASAIYTLGAAAIGLILPFRNDLIKYLSPIATFLIIPIYIWLNLLAKLDLSIATGKISIALIFSRVFGKVIGLSFLAGMGLTVSLVIANITLKTDLQLAQVRAGLFCAALISGALGLAWLTALPGNTGAPRQD